MNVSSDATVQNLRCEYLADPPALECEHPRLSWMIRSMRRGERQRGFQVLVASSPRLLEADEGDLWDSGMVESDQSIGVRYGGAGLAPHARAYWKVRVLDADKEPTAWSADATWGRGPAEQDWRGVWIGAEDAPAPSPRHFFRNGDPDDAAAITPPEAPALLLRREAEIPGGVQRAMVYLCGLGYAELHINGTRVGDSVMDPVFTDYSRRVSYTVHDVTSLMRPGANAIGVLLGNGFYNSPTPDLFQFEKADWRTPPKLRLDLLLEFDDSRTLTISSDDTWRWRTGPIRYNSIRGGETIDARIDVGNWSSPGLDESGWANAMQVRAPVGRLVPQLVPPMRVVEEFEPVSTSEPAPGTYVADFGRNLTGWVRLIGRGQSGQVVRIGFSEALESDGTIAVGHSGGHTYGRFQHEELILSGRPESDVFEPRFTYHGFRYVQVSGLEHEPGELRARLVHTDLEAAGTFHSTNPRLNQLHSAVRRTLLDSVHGLPAEEPTREKMGWTQDAQNTMGSYAFEFNAHAIFRKYLDDLIDAQEPSGHVPPIVPTQGWGYLDDDGDIDLWDDPWWGGTLAILADQMHVHYGDLEAVEAAYEPSRRYLDWMSTTTSDYIVRWELGDWLELNHDGPTRLTPVPVTSTAGYFFLATLLSRHAMLLGRADDVALYAELADRIRIAFDREFLRPEGWYCAADSQTAQALALHVGLAGPAHQDRVRRALVDDVRRRGDRLTSGFIGVMPVLYELSDHGHLDSAYRAVTHEQGSGWLYMVDDDNSTLGENIHPQGYGTRHHPFGACIGAWLYRVIAGIRPDPSEPGFRGIIIRPGLAPGLTAASAHHDSPYGRVASSWRRKGDRFELSVTVPPNTTALVHVPAASPEAVVEGGVAVSLVPGVELVSSDAGGVVLAVAAGVYRFASDLPADG